MTEHNRMPARQIIVYGDCWPVTIAVAHLVRRFLPGCNCETAYRLPVLLQQLRRKPEAILILCLRPREHLFLFYSLRQILPEPAQDRSAGRLFVISGSGDGLSGSATDI